MIRSVGILKFAGALLAFAAFTGNAQAAFFVQVTGVINVNGSSNGNTVVGNSALALQGLVPPDKPTDITLGTASSPTHSLYGVTSLQSTTPTGSTDHFDVLYSVTLSFAHIVNNVATGSQGSITFGGRIQGNVNSSTSTLANTFTSGPVSFTAPVTVDGTTIFVLLDPYTPPSSPPASNVQDFSVALYSQPVPEPTTFALMGVGGLIVMAPYLRRKARKTA